MPVSKTTLGRPSARVDAPDVLPSAVDNASASQIYVVFGAQWLAYAIPYRRFTADLADDSARLGADVVRYSFIVMDFHHLLLAGLTGARPSYTLCSRNILYGRLGLLSEPIHEQSDAAIADQIGWPLGNLNFRALDCRVIGECGHEASRRNRICDQK